MRGLLFTGGCRPDMKQARRFFGTPDAVYAADSGIAGALEAGFEPDRIVGDMDSIEDPSILETIDPGRVFRADRDKDFTDTELAVSLMRQNGIGDIVLVGGGGGRMDHFFALEKLFSLENPPQIWIGSETIAFVLDKAGMRKRITVSGLTDEPVSVFSAGTSPHRCTAQGLKWAVDSLDWDNGAYSLSNRAVGGSFSLEAVSGRFLVILPISGEWVPG